VTTIDGFIIAVYLIAVFAISLYRPNRSRSLKEYAVGKKDFNSWAIFSTLSAAIVGANTTLGLSAQTYAFGIVFLISYFGCSIQQLLVTVFFAPRLKRYFPQALSMGDVMGQLYGKYGQVCSGLFSLIFCLGIMSAQVAGMGYIFYLFFGVSQTIGCFIGCGVVIGYAALGGIKGVVNVNVLQLVILTVVLLMISSIGVQEARGMARILKVIPASHWALFKAMTPTAFISLFLLRVFGTMMAPPYLQRILIAKNLDAYKRGSFAAAFFFVPIFSVSALVGLVALALYPDIQASLAMPVLIKNMLPPVLLGFAIIGLLAVIMSTTDSWLHAASVTFVYDILIPLKLLRLAPHKEVNFMRALTLFLGFFTLVFSLNFSEIPSIVAYSCNFWTPTLLVPFVFAICGVCIRLKGFFISILSGACSTYLWNMYCLKISEVEGLLVGMLVNALVFLCFKYQEKKSPRQRSFDQGLNAAQSLAKPKARLREESYR
jgi:solute:Na+ symporter, SSS family